MPRRFRAPRPPFYEQHSIDNNPRRHLTPDRIVPGPDGIVYAEFDTPVNVQGGETIEVGPISVPVGEAQTESVPGATVWPVEAGRSWGARVAPSAEDLRISMGRLASAGHTAAEATSNMRNAISAYEWYGVDGPGRTSVGPVTGTYTHRFVPSSNSRTSTFREILGLISDDPAEVARTEEARKEAAKLANEKALTTLSNWLSSTFYADPLMVLEALVEDATLKEIVAGWKAEYDAKIKGAANARL